MAEYFYKGFKIFYDIKQAKNELYQATAHIICSVEHEAPALTQKFHTEYPTKQGVQKEIKQIIEDYIDFEWAEFRKMQKEQS
jgi:hypothetical protein